MTPATPRTSHWLVAALCGACLVAGFSCTSDGDGTADAGSTPGPTSSGAGGSTRANGLSGAGGALSVGGAGGAGGGPGPGNADGGGATPSEDAGSSGIGGVGVVGGGGAGGRPAPSDPCAGRPMGCVELCEGGNCQCDCSNTEPCPAEMPSEGEACNTYESCAYGPPECHKGFDCFFSKWKLMVDTCGEATPGSCPATIEDAVETPCLTEPCGYFGMICTCRQACPGQPGGRATSCEGLGPAACVLPSPALGEDCRPEGQICNAPCCGPGGFMCEDGTWKRSTHFVECPP